MAATWRSGADLEDWGFSFGDWRWWLPRVALFAFLAIGMVVFVSYLSPDMRRAYPLMREARESLTALARYELSLGWYMLGWEFFFRGFLLFGLAKRGDVRLAILVQAIPFHILHQHKPELEMAASFVGALGAA